MSEAFHIKLMLLLAMLLSQRCLLAKEINASNDFDQKSRRNLEGFASLTGKCCVGEVQLQKGRRGHFLIGRKGFQPSNVLE